MNLIDDVRADIRALDCSKQGLVKFGRTIGTTFLLFAVAIFFFHHINTVAIVCALVGGVLVLFSGVAPLLLYQVYRIWMGIAFVLGWIVSRAILALFFFIIITPVAFAARMTGKKFLNTDFKTGQQSYWIEKKSHSRYDKMS